MLNLIFMLNILLDIVVNTDTKNIEWIFCLMDSGKAQWSPSIISYVIKLIKMLIFSFKYIVNK